MASICIINSGKSASFLIQECLFIFSTELVWIPLARWITVINDFRIIRQKNVRLQIILLFLIIILDQCSGDSTVPEWSSTFGFYHWANAKKTEVPKADHNELLRDEEVIDTILSYAIEDFDPPQLKKKNKLYFKPDLSRESRIFDKSYWRLPKE